MGMNNEKAATEIRKAYNTYQTLPDTNKFMTIAELHNRTDLTAEWMLAGILHLMGTEQGFMVLPESNQKMLTQEARDAAVIIGNQPKHLVSWS
jgi:hypothetical protein